MAGSRAGICRRRSRSRARGTTTALLLAWPSATSRSTKSTMSSGSLTAICLLIPLWYQFGMRIRSSLGCSYELGTGQGPSRWVRPLRTVGQHGGFDEIAAVAEAAAAGQGGLYL